MIKYLLSMFVALFGFADHRVYTGDDMPSGVMYEMLTLMIANVYNEPGGKRLAVEVVMGALNEDPELDEQGAITLFGPDDPRFVDWKTAKLIVKYMVQETKYHEQKMNQTVVALLCGDSPPSRRRAYMILDSLGDISDAESAQALTRTRAQMPEQYHANLERWIESQKPSHWAVRHDSKLALTESGISVEDHISQVCVDLEDD